MAPEYYLGAAVAVVLLILLGSMLRRSLARRHVVYTTNSVVQSSNNNDQLVNQLSRIADSLELLVTHWGAVRPRIEQPSVQVQRVSETRVEQAPVPLQRAPEPSIEQPPPVPAEKPSEPDAAEQEKIAEQRKPRVTLSMFGR